MKLADIEEPINIKAAQRYAHKHQFKIIEFVNDSETPYPNVVELLMNCIKAARKKACVEFCIHEINNRYQIMEDTHTWEVSIFGFIRK